MNALSRKSCWFALACVGLGACQTVPQNAALQCGAGGALVGFLACKALGHSDSQCAAMAAVAGAGGAGICYTYAASLERRRQELAGHENDLDARIKYVRGLNEDSQQLNAQLSKQVADMTRSTDELVAQIRQRKISDERLASERQSRDKAIELAREQAAKSSEALKEVKAYRSQSKPQSAQLDAELAKQEMFDAAVRKQVSLLVAQRARV